METEEWTPSFGRTVRWSEGEARFQISATRVLKGKEIVLATGTGPTIDQAEMALTINMAGQIWGHLMKTKTVEDLLNE